MHSTFCNSAIGLYNIQNMSKPDKTAHFNTAVSFYGLNAEDHCTVNWDTRYHSPALSGCTKLDIS